MKTSKLLSIFLIFLLKNDLFQSVPLKLGSFNIQSLGPTKMSRPEFLSSVLNILSNYDIVCIQEIKDSTNNTVIIKLVDELTKYVNKTTVKYSYSISSRLGSGNYKEQLAFVFNSKKIKFEYDEIYNDVNQVYERPPYIGKFSIIKTKLALKDFFILNLHLRPDYVLTESLELRNVVDHILLDDSNHNIAIMGDLNFDCNYVSNKSRNMVRAKLYDFTWYISDKVSTTVSSNSCAYDRILFTGDILNNAVVPNSNKTYYYYEDLGLDLSEAAKISDHFPVEIQLKVH